MKCAGAGGVAEVTSGRRVVRRARRAVGWGSCIFASVSLFRFGLFDFRFGRWLWCEEQSG